MVDTIEKNISKKDKSKSKPKPKNKKKPENKKKKTNQNKIKRTLIVNCFKMTKS